jgi:hypothetical protein
MKDRGYGNQSLPQRRPEVPITRCADVAAIDIPAVPQEDIALLEGPRADNSANEGIIDNGTLGYEEAGDFGPAMGGGGAYGPIEDGAGAWGGSLVEGNCVVEVQYQAWQYPLHCVKIAKGGSFFHNVSPLALDMGSSKRSVTCN